MKRPTSITVIGWLFIVCGGYAVGSIIWELLSRKLELNFMALMLPIGIGLLNGRKLALWWAKFWIVGFSLLFVLLLIFGVFFWELVSVSFSASPQGEFVILILRPAVIGFSVVSLLITSWMWRCLSNPASMAFFENGADRGVSDR